MSTNKYFTQDANKGLSRSAFILFLGTLSSRILGFARDVVLAKILGTSIFADAFFVAFRIPNLFRDVLGEGAMNSSVVPVISEYEHKSEQKHFWDFLSTLAFIFLIFLSAITLAGIVLAPFIVRVIAPGLAVDPEQFLLTVQLTRIMFPYLIFIGLTAYSMGVLFTFRSFKAPAFGPCLLNLSMIISAFLSIRQDRDPVFFLAVGVLIGGVLQLMAQVIPIFLKKVRISFPRSFNHPGIKKIGKLLLPRLFGSAVYQMSVFVDTFCASLSFIVGAGGISAIYYANRIFQLPMGLFGFAVASAILPTLSGFASREEMPAFERTLRFALKNILFFMLPISLFLFLWAQPIIRVLFQRGEFDSYSTAITSWALLFYAIGLFFFAGIKILSTSFHALQDTATPAKVAGLCLVLNISLNFLLMVPLKVGGIALASSISAMVNFFILFYFLNRRFTELGQGLLYYGAKILLCSVAMGAVGKISFETLGFLPEAGRLVVTFFTSFISFVFFCFFLKIDHANQLFRWIFKKA